MKKIFKFLMSLLLVFTITSCEKDETSEKFMIKGHIENTTLINIDAQELKEMIIEEQSFILLIMLNGCTSCEGFKQDIVNPFIEESKSNIYSISSIELDSLQYDNKPSYSIAPTIVIYKDGKEIIKKEYNYKDAIFTDKNEFSTFIYSYCVEPRLIELDEDNADQKIENNDSFVLYVGWYRCGDCQMLSSEVLDNYLLNNDKTMYYLESDKYRSLKPIEEPILSENPTQEQLQEKENWDNWIAFANKYGFASYRDGKVPSIIYYENGIVKDYIVYRNDVITDGIVTQSYYDDLIGQKLDNDQLLQYHNDKVVEFLNKYCK